MFEPTITKDTVNTLPVCTYTGKIVVVDTPEKCTEAVAFLNQQAIIGFDTETRPSFIKGIQHKVSLLQLATNDICFLFRLNLIGIPKELVVLLQNKNIQKVGVAIDNDKMSLRKLKVTKLDGFIDLQKIVGQFGIQDISLQKMYAILFGKKISKSQRLSNWESATLTKEQQEYAAIDAWASLEMYLKLKDIA
jgi:ribonuclease D